MSVLGAIAKLFMILYAPESPKWLLGQERREDAIMAFNTIAKMNGSNKFIPEDATFDEKIIPKQNLDTSSIS